MKKLAIAYRNNDLFAKYLPAVWEALKTLGYEIVLNVFPPDTAEENARAKMVSVLHNESAGIAYIHDSTCTLPEEARKQIYQKGVRIRNILLDKMFVDLMWDRFHGRDKTFESGFKTLLPMIIQGRQVTSVHIVVRHLADHVGGFYDVDWMVPSKDEEKLAKEISWHARDTLRWFHDSGITNYANLPEALAACSQDDSALLIADRHVLYKEMEESLAQEIIHWKHRCLLFCLPFSNAVSHLVQQGKLSEVFTTEALVNELHERLLR